MHDVTITRCCPNGTEQYWSAVECRPLDRPRFRRPARPLTGSVTDDRRQREQTSASKTILAH